MKLSVDVFIDKLSQLKEVRDVVSLVLECHNDLGFEGSRYYDVVHSPLDDSKFLILRAWSGRCCGVAIGDTIFDGPRSSEEYEDGEPRWDLVDNLQNPERYPYISKYKLVSWVTVPIKSQETIFGFWSIDRTEKVEPSAKVFDVMKRVSQLAGLKIFELRQSRINEASESIFPDDDFETYENLERRCLEKICATMSASFAALFMIDPVGGGLRKRVEVFYNGTRCVELPSEFSVHRYSPDAFDKKLLNIPDFPTFQDSYRDVMSESTQAVHEEKMGTAVATVMFHTIDIPGAQQGLIRVVNRVDEPKLSFNKVHEGLMNQMTQPIGHVLAVQYAREKFKALGKCFSVALSAESKISNASIGAALQANGFPFVLMTAWYENGRMRDFWTNNNEIRNGLKLVSKNLSFRAVRSLGGGKPKITNVARFPKSLRTVLENAGVRHVYAVPSQDNFPKRFSPETILMIVPLCVSNGVNGVEETAFNERFWKGRPNLIEFLEVIGQFACASEHLGRASDLLYNAGEAISVVGHDLRAPAASIKSLGRDVAIAAEQLALKVSNEGRLTLNIGSVDKSAQVHYVSQDDPSEIVRWFKLQRTALNEHGQHLEEIINRILRWARADTNMVEYEFELVDIYAIIRSCMRGLSKEVEQKNGLTIEVRDNVRSIPRIIGDPIELKNLFNNLLDNAIKYSWSPGEGYTEKILVYASPQSDFVDFHIENWGIGISEDEYENIFSSFYRTKIRDETHKVRGVGMGLYSCKRIAKAHGGNIFVRSMPTLEDEERSANMEGYRTTFSVRISTKLRPGRVDIESL